MNEFAPTTEKLKAKSLLLVNGVKSVSDFLSDLVNVFKDSGIDLALEKTLPWAEYAGDSIGAFLPPVKFLVKLAEKLLKETDPEKLLKTACTIAYIRSLEEAFHTIGGPTSEKISIKEAKKQLREIKACEEVDISTFSVETSLQHEFISLANLHLQTVAIRLGYSEDAVYRLTQIAQNNFRNSLEKLLAEVAGFKPAIEYLRFDGAKSRRARRMLLLHKDYQCWLYREAPVFGISQFSLKDIYVDTQCSHYSWKEMLDLNKRIDPFHVGNDGRHDLIDKLFKLLESDDLSEAILIQGVAGSGKTSLTLKLCEELVERGFSPIRIRIRDLNFDRPIKDTFPPAIRFTEKDYGLPEPDTMKDLFLEGEIFKEKSIKHSHISKYVLILDGWDEISTTHETFKTKIARIFEQIRGTFLEQRNPRVRVILTGRPSPDIADTNCLREATQILTIQPLSVGSLSTYIEKLHRVTSKPARKYAHLSVEKWAAPPIEKFDGIFRRYPYPIDILGSPLLAFLAIRLLAESDRSPEELFNTRTLYRNLIDLTCRKAAKAEIASNELGGEQHKIFGNDLRALLWKTATAIALYGKDNIPQEELASYLRKKAENITEEIRMISDEQKLSSLLISFYFKTGQKHLGCEFAHKSFREYLFAEAIFEVLKNCVRMQEEIPFPRTGTDFPASDPRYDASRSLCEMLAPLPLTNEVKEYLLGVIEWEIEQSFLPATDVATGPFKPLTFAELTRICALLADLWDWWGDRAHMLSSQVPGGRKEKKRERAFVTQLVEDTPFRSRKNQATTYADLAGIDAQIGDGLYFLLTTFVQGIHSKQPFDHDSNIDLLSSFHDRDSLKFRDFGHEWSMVFSPFGENFRYYHIYMERLRNLDDKESKFSPGRYIPDFVSAENAELKGADILNAIFNKISFARAEMNNAFFRNASFREADLREADLRSSQFLNSSFYDTDLSKAQFTGSPFIGTSFANVKVHKTSFQASSFIHKEYYYVLKHGTINPVFGIKPYFSACIFRGQNMCEAILLEADFFEAEFNEVNFSRAYLMQAIFSNTRILDVDFREANLHKTQFEKAKIYTTRMHGADLSEANLFWAELYDVDLSMADLRWANLSGARFSSNVQLTGTNLNGARLTRNDSNNYTVISREQLLEAFFDYIVLDGNNISRKDFLKMDW